MDTITLKRLIAVKKWIKSCHTDNQIDTCIKFIRYYTKSEPYLMKLCTLQRLIINNMDDEAIAYSRQIEGDEILKQVDL